MAQKPASHGLKAVALQLSCLWLLWALLQLTSAQDSNNAQGALVYSMGKWLTTDDTEKLTALGWVNGGNPCTGTWKGVTCNEQGYVTAIALPNQGLAGSLPPESSIWGGLTGLSSVDLSGNSLGGSVPSQLTAAGPQLKTINLSGNGNICGTTAAPAGVEVIAVGTKFGTDCSAVAAPNNSTASPAPSTSPDITPLPAAVDNSSSPAAAPAATPAPAAAASDGAAPVVAVPAAPAAPSTPSPPPTPISDAPVCSCALKGFGSDECASALKGVCKGSDAPALCTAGPDGTLKDPSTDEVAAEQLGQYLADACFPNQDKNTNICTCVQNLLGTDCAKARVASCVAKDPLCLPFQNIIDVNGSSSAAAMGQVAPVLDQKCPISEPSVPGVKATMEFPSLSVGQYITKQYTQNVANALSAVTNVPSGSISTLDVRPFIGPGSSPGRRRARSLMQSGGNGVQATYFLQTEDPTGVSQKLSAAAESGQLSRQLGQYGITSPAGSLKVQSFTPAASSPAPASSSSFPMWAIAPIVVGAVLLLALLGLLLFCCKRRNRNKKAQAYAPTTKAVDEDLPVAKSYEYTPAPLNSYAPAADTVSTASKSVSINRPPTPEDLPVSRSIKANSADQGDVQHWEADNAAAPASLPPLATSAAAAGGAAAAGATAASAWKSNVRPASGTLPAGAATSSMSGAKNAQQAERAKFWAQFQETWQQVRQNQNINDGEPGSPSSGTNWTDVTGQQSPKRFSTSGQ